MSTSHKPPGSLLARFFKHFYHFRIVGLYIVLTDIVRNVFTKTPIINFSNKRAGQVAVITGGARGIGFDITKKLLQLDYTVILGVRSLAAAEKGIERIRLVGITSGQVKLFQLDLKSLRSVRRFADLVLTSKEGVRIDLLLNNAGIMNAPFEQTEDNFESHFQINYLSHFLLTNLLLPRMKETADTKGAGSCQIVNTSSLAQRSGHINFDELETSKVYSPMKSYMDSKLCQVIHARTLENQFRDERLTNIHAYSVHPGEVTTDLWEHLGPIVLAFKPIARRICRTSDDAANVVLLPVLSRECGLQGGQYFESGQVVIPNEQVEDEQIQRRLWDRSLIFSSRGRHDVTQKL